jgi:hypothetical protein
MSQLADLIVDTLQRFPRLAGLVLGIAAHPVLVALLGR